MSRILCLAASGFGKTTGICEINLPSKGIVFKGAPVNDSFLISVTSKPLPYATANSGWKVTSADKLRDGRRVITNDSNTMVKVLAELAKSPIKNVIIDDFNYIMQDWYMDNALLSGWDAPKTIGYKMGKIFKEIEKFEGVKRNVIVLAHGEPIVGKDGRIYMKLKTTGKMVDEYTTPEGKFDVTLIGKSYYDTTLKRAIKEYVTNEDENYSSPKSPLGMFSKLYISNDLGYIIDRVEAYNNGILHQFTCHMIRLLTTTSFLTP